MRGYTTDWGRGDGENRNNIRLDIMIIDVRLARFNLIFRSPLGVHPLSISPTAVKSA